MRANTISNFQKSLNTSMYHNITARIFLCLKQTLLQSFILKLKHFLHQFSSSDFDVRVHMSASVVSWFNSSINPIIYVILNPRFRREYIRLIKIAFGKAGSRFFHDSTSVSVKHNVEKNEGKKSRSNSTFNDTQLKVAVQKQESQDTLDTTDKVNE